MKRENAKDSLVRDLTRIKDEGGFKVKDLADLCDIPRSTMGYYLNGREICGRNREKITYFVEAYMANEQKKKSTPPKKVKKDKSTVGTMRETDKIRIQEIKRAYNLKLDSDACSILIRAGYEQILRKGVENFDIAPYMNDLK